MRTIVRTGYTMIEMVVVMLVMGILAAVAAPRYRNSTARFRVEAAARRIVADINHVRGNTMMKGTLAGGKIIFFPLTEEYQLTATPDLDHPNREYWVDLSKTAYPVDLVSAEFTNTAGAAIVEAVKYDMYGFPRSGSSSEAPLASGQIVVASGGQLRTIAIDPLTGKASVQ